MADKAVSELIEAERITATDLFVLEQNGTAKKLTGQVLLNWLTAAADGHGGIQSIQKVNTSGLMDTYRITLADTTTFDFVVSNGRGISEIAKTAQLCGDKIHIYSGNDDQIIPVMSLGGLGCISVLSNLLPKETVKMAETFFSGDVKAAAKMQLDFIPLIDALFSEVNPIPVKAAMAKMGFCEDYLRLPLTPMEDATRAVLYEEMEKMGIK